MYKNFILSEFARILLEMIVRNSYSYLRRYSVYYKHRIKLFCSLFCWFAYRKVINNHLTKTCVVMVDQCDFIITHLFFISYPTPEIQYFSTIWSDLLYSSIYHDRNYCYLFLLLLLLYTMFLLGTYQKLPTPNYFLIVYPNFMLILYAGNYFVSI